VRDAADLFRVNARNVDNNCSFILSVACGMAWWSSVVAWEDPFDRPLQVSEGKPLVTLADARDYILSLSPHRQKTYRALAAIEALLMAATKSAPIIDAMIRMMKLIQQESEVHFAGEKPLSKIPEVVLRRSRA
jgi:hypothetical protein